MAVTNPGGTTFSRQRPGNRTAAVHDITGKQRLAQLDGRDRDTKSQEEFDDQVDRAARFIAALPGSPEANARNLLAISSFMARHADALQQLVAEVESRTNEVE